MREDLMGPFCRWGDRSSEELHDLRGITGPTVRKWCCPYDAQIYSLSQFGLWAWLMRVSVCVFAWRVCFHSPKVGKHLYLKMDVLWGWVKCRRVCSVGWWLLSVLVFGSLATCVECRGFGGCMRAYSCVRGRKYVLLGRQESYISAGVCFFYIGFSFYTCRKNSFKQRFFKNHI